MRLFATVEERAFELEQPVARLRYLRQAHRRRASRRAQVLQAVRISTAASVMLCGTPLGRSKPTAMLPAPPLKRVIARLNPASTPPANSVWVVEEDNRQILYSNGLTVNRGYETTSIARRYAVYRRDSLARFSEMHAEPAGIVYHTTESHMFSLEAAHNGALLRIRGSVLDQVRNGRSYNFVIDRFGQVFRIVPEEQTAFHAGHSVWADAESVWINLNESFLGVSFEAESSGPFEPSAAQVHSGRLLTEVLRARFHIPDGNCVTHAQVSVNPDNQRIGYHTDWGSAFPFAAMGLTEGYGLPVAAVAVFGFEHDETFLHATGGRLWPGLARADQELEQQASKEGITAGELRLRLQENYKAQRRQRHG